MPTLADIWSPLILTASLAGVTTLLLLVIGTPIAWWLGTQDLAEIRSGRMDPAGEGMTQTGRILGMISSILTVVTMLGCCLFYVIIFAAVGAGSAGR